jgi:hypothetical protein
VSGLIDPTTKQLALRCVAWAENLALVASHTHNAMHVCPMAIAHCAAAARQEFVNASPSN